MALAGLSACTQVKETLTVTVNNPLPIERQGEMVEIPMDKVVKELGLADTAQVVVWDKDGVEVPYQITYDDKLIFPASVAFSFSVYSFRRNTKTSSAISGATCCNKLSSSVALM